MMKLTLRGKIVLGLLSFIIIAGILTTSLTTFATKKDAEVNYTFYTVKLDDTIWSIACEFTPKNKDVRKTQYEIMKLNNISPDELKPGMRIAIFKD